jgi:hypothetical protein
MAPAAAAPSEGAAASSSSTPAFVPAQPLPEYDAAFTSAAVRVRALLDDASAWTGPVLTSGVNVYMPAKEDPVYLGARGDCILPYSARTLLNALVEDASVRAGA